MAVHSWPCPSLASALWRAGSVPNLGNTVELARVEAGTNEPGLQVREHESWPCPSLAVALGELAVAVLNSSPW